MKSKYFKSVISFIIALFTAITIIALQVSATDEAYIKTGSCGTNVTWTLNIQNRTLTISGSGDMTNYTYSNRSPWTDYSSYVKYVIVEDGITSIGSYSFYDMETALTNVELPESLKRIGNYAFYFCELLENIVLPDNVEAIGNHAFSYCKKLSSIKLPKELKVIETYAFSSCYKLGTIIIPESVTTIKDNAFAFGGGTKKDVEFLGDMPTFVATPFYSSSVNVYYPCNNSTWDSVWFSDFGGTVTWNIRHANNDYSKFVPDRINKTITGVCEACNQTYTQSVDWTDCVNVDFQIGVKTKTMQTFTVSCVDGCDVEYQYSGYSGVTINDSFNGTIYTKVNIKTPGLHRLKVCGSAGGNDLYYTVFVVNHQYTKETLAATCTKKGADYYTCNLCGYKYTDNEADPLGHELTNYCSNNNATCTKDGTETAHCIRCDYSHTRTAVNTAKGHISVQDKAIAATCEKTGKTTGSHCSVCGFVIEPQNAVPALGHKAVTDKAVAATCTKTGKTTGSHCSVCGKVLKAQKTVLKKAHTYKYSTTKADAINKKNGKIVAICSVCKGKKTAILYYPKKVVLSYTKTTYTGKSLKPSVSVRDANGEKISSSNYDVVYVNNKNVGQATVTITFKGRKYKGTIKKTFIINPMGTWADSWSVQSTSFWVGWEKQAKQTSGYIVQYSTTKDFTKNTTKTVKIGNPNTVQLTVKNCKRNTVYYVRVRTYKVVGKQTYYSGWQAPSYGQELPLKLKTKR